MKRLLALLIAILLSALLNVGLGLTWSLPGLAADLPKAPIDSVQSVIPSQLFATHCAGCHIRGGNIVRRGKTLKLKALQKYHMDSLAAITQIITVGKGAMSAYQDRLTAAQIQSLAAYVLEQAQQDWSS